MKVCLVGSKSITRRPTIETAVDKVISELNSNGKAPTILTTGTLGADRLITEYAESKGLDVVIFEPYHKLDPKAEFTPSYFFIRNKAMVRQSDLVCVIPEQASREIEHVIEYAHAIGTTVCVWDHDTGNFVVFPPAQVVNEEEDAA